jgi:hypothetical protein
MTEHKDTMTPEHITVRLRDRRASWFGDGSSPDELCALAADTIEGLEELLFAATILTATGKGLSPEESINLHTLLDVRENEPPITKGKIAAALVEANAARMAQAAEIAALRAEIEELDFLRHEGGPDSVAAMEKELIALRAERELDHANINLKAEFIAATVDQLAQMEAERDAALSRVAELETALAEIATAPPHSVDGQIARAALANKGATE